MVLGSETPTDSCSTPALKPGRRSLSTGQHCGGWAGVWPPQASGGACRGCPRPRASRGTPPFPHHRAFRWLGAPSPAASDTSPRATARRRTPGVGRTGKTRWRPNYISRHAAGRRAGAAVAGGARGCWSRLRELGRRRPGERGAAVRGRGHGEGWRPFRCSGGGGR